MPDNLKTLKKAAANLSLSELEKFADWCEDRIAKARYEELCDDAKGIEPRQLLSSFRKFVENPSHLKTMTAEEASSLIQGFYEEIRVRGCRFEDEADMLLVEWGPSGKSQFTLAYTRQIVPPTKSGESDPWQLRLELTFPLTSELSKTKPGKRWFESLAKMDQFYALTLATRPFSTLAETHPQKVRLTFSNAE